MKKELSDITRLYLGLCSLSRDLEFVVYSLNIARMNLKIDLTAVRTLMSPS